MCFMPRDIVMSASTTESTSIGSTQLLQAAFTSSPGLVRSSFLGCCGGRFCIFGILMLFSKKDFILVEVPHSLLSLHNKRDWEQWAIPLFQRIWIFSSSRNGVGFLLLDPYTLVDNVCVIIILSTSMVDNTVASQSGLSTVASQSGMSTV